MSDRFGFDEDLEDNSPGVRLPSLQIDLKFIFKGFLLSLFVLALIGAVGYAAYWILFVRPGMQVSLQEGDPAPDFTLMGEDGTEVSLNQFQGKPVVLAFIDPGSEQCRSALIEMQTAYETYAAQGFVALAVSSGESAEAVAAYKQELNLTFPVLLDADGSVKQRWGVNSAPSAFLVDAEGKISKAVLNPESGEDIGDEIGGLVQAATAGMVLPEPTQAVASPTPEPSPEPVEAQPLVEGCVTALILNTRIGPGIKFPAVGGLPSRDCQMLDAQSPDGKWLRLADKLSESGDRLWVSADYMILNGDKSILPVAE